MILNRFSTKLDIAKIIFSSQNVFLEQIIYKLYFHRICYAKCRVVIDVVYFGH